MVTRDIAKSERPQGFDENMKVAKCGGKVTKGARELYEQETKMLAISNENVLDYQYINQNSQIENK